MNKQILIIGGGISGLSTLHFLKQKYKERHDIQIHLLEKNDHVGGTIRTVCEDGFRFELGPNGFLSNTPTTFELVEDLGLHDKVISADENAKIRYIFAKGRLHQLPTGVFSFLGFELLSLADKFRVLQEPFVKKGSNPEETVYEFGKRRLGENFSKYFLDPMVSGIFGGNTKELNLKSAFPKIYHLEQTYGSLIKGALALKKSRKNEKTPFGQPRGTLTSFIGGMGDLTASLYAHHKDNIMLNTSVESITRENEKYIIATDVMSYAADQVFLSVPAYQAARILAPMDGALSQGLAKIPYAPMAVAGFAYRKKDVQNAPAGFGYLIPSVERKKVLGVLFSSNIFPGRAQADHMLFQVMIGGGNHPDILNYPHNEIKKLAKEELESVLGVKAAALQEFFVCWPQAIPQYNKGYLVIAQAIKARLAHAQGLFLAANYLSGVSLNDCIANAKRIVSESII